MAGKGINIGQYLDPMAVDSSVKGVIDPSRPSWGAGVMSLRPTYTEVPLSNGQTAVVNQEGIIVDIY